MALHVFWDNSNVWGGMQDLRKLNEPEVPWYALRVYFRNLYDLVVQGREVTTKVMGGSVPPECDELWGYARGLGFDTDLLKRVDKEGHLGEQAVDEVLHLKIGNAILDHGLPQTLALLSGDGKVSDYGTSFPGQVERALKAGWDVELYSASTCLSRFGYSDMQDVFGDRIKIIQLDDYYNKLTFVRGGEYYYYDEEKNKIFFDVKERIVREL